MARWKAAIAIVAAVAGSVLVAATPASANTVNTLCKTVDNAWQYDQVGYYGGIGAHEFTLHADRGYRSYDVYYRDGYGRWWIGGHGAEHPNNPGWILWYHTNCPPP